MSGFTLEKQAQATALGMTVAERVRDYFTNAQHRRDFELWYKKQYGRAYKWVSLENPTHCSHEKKKVLDGHWKEKEA